jgi:hypothetical protein
VGQGCSSPQQIARRPLPPMQERHIFSVNANSHTNTNNYPFTLYTLKMASEKKVAENMLWGGRFTGMLPQWLHWHSSIASVCSILTLIQRASTP